MLAAATSFFARTAISQSYTVGGSGSRPATPGSSNANYTPGSSTQIIPPSLSIGLWKVQPAFHKVTHKRVSVWSCDKRGPEMDRLGAGAKEMAIEVMKAEASALSRLRHPSILEMVEPLEETRSELIFATEPILSSLELSIPGAGRRSPLVELDEVEIQKGILQICKGLSFLHSSAQLVHSHICPESIIINNAGDWKISGLGLTIPLMTNGSPTRWEFPAYDGRMPPYIQRSFDYMAPEYALDEQIVTGSDMYSLGCLIYAVHCKGQAPFKNHGSLTNLRDNAGKAPPGLERLDPDLQALLRSLITRHATNRPTPTTLPNHPFFSSLPISTLNFLDRSNFTAKTREEKIAFMKGLTNVLDRFSDGLRTRKILPSLLEEMKDFNLLPYILPNVFSISNALSPSQFASLVLPSLKPVFAVKEPPQNMLTLLDNLQMLQSKTDKLVFREQVLPLVYNALESEHTAVQERALKIVPDLCETIDYAEVQSVLFPRVALVFTKTRILSVKVATLTAFLSMVKTLDQSSLTQKLVPLLSKIRTKEPAVMMATLSVQEAMGMKVDREAVATLVLPQLWMMSIGPLLNVDQFYRFMSVIKKLGDRVEKEHNQYLRDSQRIEDRSALASNGGALGNQSFATTVDFESLVARGSASGSMIQVPVASAATSTSNVVSGNGTSWEDEVWGSIFNDNASTPIVSPTSSVIQTHAPAKLETVAASATLTSSSSTLGQRTSSSWTIPPPIAPPSRQTTTSPPSFSSHLRTTGNTLSPSTPTARKSFSHQPAPKPNYNINLSTIPMSSSSSPPAPLVTPPTIPASNAFYNYNNNGRGLGGMPQVNSSFSQPIVQPSMGGLLAPSKLPQKTGPLVPRKPSKNDWGEFDPLA
ncbi:hypothetical protein AMATHDRAFT_76388 [Amanita thiersii Skay4041]|uniref:Protein kinase domain-containing protein n=1 Tax=Amanita thiersii Skay4041 TaxID=703135 RepID=A0A2A9NLG8_9AGAR|nr:hypothetical protein AMATHDRAFT_76388 [Amanita thiersii Skay4041]